MCWSSSPWHFSRGAAPNRSRVPRPGPAPDSRRCCSPPRTSLRVCSTNSSLASPARQTAPARRPRCCPVRKAAPDGLTRVIADSAERGPGSAAEYLVAYDGARMVITVLTWRLDLDRLAAVADRCAEFETFFDPSTPGIPMTTTRMETPRRRRVGVRADHEVGRHTEKRLLLLREHRGHRGVRRRVSDSQSVDPRQRFAATDVSGYHRKAGGPRAIGLSRSARREKPPAAMVTACSVAKCRPPPSPSTVSACP